MGKQKCTRTVLGNRIHLHNSLLPLPCNNNPCGAILPISPLLGVRGTDADYVKPIAGQCVFQAELKKVSQEGLVGNGDAIHNVGNGIVTKELTGDRRGQTAETPPLQHPNLDRRCPPQQFLYSNDTKYYKASGLERITPMLRKLSFDHLPRMDSNHNYT
eukprot:5826656-Amphidinium_carterae.2